MSDLFAINYHDKMAEAQREEALRRSVYPRWIEAGRLKQEKADRQIAIMRAIGDDYALLAAVEMPIVKCRTIGAGISQGETGPVLALDTFIDRPKDVPRRVDLQVPLDGYSATEIARVLLPWLAVNAGDNWSRVMEAFERAKEARQA